MGYFRQIRNVELSMLKYLTDNLAIDWTGVTLVKRFLDAYDEDVPVVAVGLGNITPYKQEIGASSIFQDCEIIVDIFAKSDGQRLDLADYITDKLKDGCVYYTHSHTSGDNSTLELVEDGRVTLLQFFENTRVEFPDAEVEIHDKFRHTISVLVRKTT